MAAIIPHEFGHAVAARACGLKVFRIHMGFGRTFLRRPVLGFETEFKVIPLGGSTIALPVTDKFRRKWFLYVLAGPTANLLLCVAVT
ncbi:MAG: Regulator of sigma-E protease RseP [Verrucomicrobia subdivision 3 bacterium]|nr:Regulator of sigma-E protease RseP [Limisphaerales bacterium]MCS1415640.1 Regulator of sigma-E protease RseP [Limisphaerales bacterium]